MSNWMKASVDCLFYEDTAYVDLPCEVYLDGEQIKVRYEDDDSKIIVYIGREVSEGHFELAYPPLQGRATLHRFPGAKIFHGFWDEEGQIGAWKITLHENT